MLILTTAIFIHTLGHTNSKPNYYTEPAIEFLRKYGKIYNLLNPFFEINQKLEWKYPYSLELLNTDYSTRNLSNYLTKISASTTASAQVRNELKNVTFLQNNYELDNIYRYGPKQQDRFLSIFFHLDPWNGELASVNFVGKGNALDNYSMICEFKYPAAFSINAVIEKKFENVMKTRLVENIIYCPIPKEMLPSFTDAVKEVILDTYMIEPKSEVTQPMLLDIHVKRMHYLEQRSYNISLCLMVNNLFDPFLVEYLTFYIALGVEHFYLFDNSKDPFLALDKTVIQPFLHANIITMIYYPYTSSDERNPLFNSIQETTFQVFLQQFGHLNTWIGFLDMDEFYFPSEDLQYFERFTEQNHSYNLLLDIVNYFESISGTKHFPGVMIETMEMGCLSTEPLGHEVTTYRAKTINCLVPGHIFKELEEGHGKMLLKSNEIHFLSSPHRLTDYWVWWSNPKKGGTIRHFDGLKYTQELHRRSINMKAVDNSFRDFVLKLLDVSVGVKPNPSE